MNRLTSILACLPLLAGCDPRNAKVLGAAPAGTSMAVATVARSAGKAIVVSGTMIQKCPVAGCWFVLRDESGTIKVDTKSANFVVLDVPLQTRVTVAGSLVTNEQEQVIEATGIRF